jgi:hypothetical protein
MKIDWSKIIKESFLFSIKPRIWLPYLLLDVFCISAMLLTIFYNISQISVAMSTQSITMLIKYLWPALFILIIWILTRLWIDGSVIYQSFKPKDFSKSWKYSFKKYPSMFSASMIIVVLTLVFGLIPYIGWIINIIISLIFFFTLQAIIVKNKGYFEGLSDSYNIFKKKWLFVLVMYVLILIIALGITIVFSIPITAILMNIFSPNMTIVSLLLLIKEQLPLILISGVILILGIDISKAFSLKAQTEFYLKLTKKF